MSCAFNLQIKMKDLGVTLPEEEAGTENHHFPNGGEFP